MIHAEKKFAKGWRGRYAWSPALSVAGWRVWYWKLRIQHLGVGKDMPQFLGRIKEKFEKEDGAVTKEEV